MNRSHLSIPDQQAAASLMELFDEKTHADTHAREDSYSLSIDLHQVIRLSAINGAHRQQKLRCLGSMDGIECRMYIFLGV